MIFTGQNCPLHAHKHFELSCLKHPAKCSLLRQILRNPSKSGIGINTFPGCHEYALKHRSPCRTHLAECGQQSNEMLCLRRPAMSAGRCFDSSPNRRRSAPRFVIRANTMKSEAATVQQWAKHTGRFHTVKQASFSVENELSNLP